MKKILLVQPSLQPPGGGNGVAAWIIEALKREHAVSVLTWWPVDLVSINRYFGTSLSLSDFTAYRVAPLGALLDRTPAPLSFLKTNLLLRAAKKMKDGYDLILTVNNEADLGCRGIQYVHFPWVYQPRPNVELRWYHGSKAIVEAYYQFCLWISGFSFDRMKENLTLVNSGWTGVKVKECHDISSTTLYPPVPGVFPEVPWTEREDGFVCIGRIAPVKEYEKIIDILVAVRAQGWPVHLHIIGAPDNPDYYERVRQRIHENASWVFLDENLSREELTHLVAQHRYGIHGMAEEHFGMAVAEMVQAGCIVFVPRGGGQVEIVDEDERLVYRTGEEAIAKIVDTLHDPAKQAALCSYLALRKERFSAERFVRQIQDVVRNFAANCDDGSLL